MRTRKPDVQDRGRPGWWVTGRAGQLRWWALSRAWQARWWAGSRARWEKWTTEARSRCAGRVSGRRWPSWTREWAAGLLAGYVGWVEWGEEGAEWDWWDDDEISDQHFWNQAPISSLEISTATDSSSFCFLLSLPANTHGEMNGTADTIGEEIKNVTVHKWS